MGVTNGTRSSVPILFLCFSVITFPCGQILFIQSAQLRHVGEFTLQRFWAVSSKTPLSFRVQTINSLKWAFSTFP